MDSKFLPILRYEFEDFRGESAEVWSASQKKNAQTPSGKRGI